MKLSKVVLTVALLTVSLSSASQNSDQLIEAGYKHCDSLSGFAAQALKARQSGLSKEMMLSIAEGSEDMVSVVELAYSEGAKLATEDEFSQALKLGCRNSVLKQVRETHSSKDAHITQH